MSLGLETRLSPGHWALGALSILGRKADGQGPAPQCAVKLGLAGSSKGSFRDVTSLAMSDPLAQQPVTKLWGGHRTKRPLQCLEADNALIGLPGRAATFAS